MKKISGRIFAAMLLILAVLFFLGYESDIPLQDLKDKYTNAHSEFIPIKNTVVHYRIEGQGHPLVLLHGTGASLHTWDDWTNILKDSFQIIRLDLPAFGLTGPNKTGDYSIDNYVDFLNDFLSKINIDTFYLAGNSLGGRIAWQYTHAYPEQVKKLILIDAAGAPNNRGMPAVFKLAKKPITAFLLRHILPKSFIEKNLKEVYFDGTKITEELINRYYKMALREGNRQAFIDRANTDYIDEPHKIAEIKNPTLILWGKHDQWVDVEDAYYFKKTIPNSFLRIYDNAGHVPMEEIAEETAEDVLEFLKN